MIKKVVADAKEKMEKTVQHFKAELKSVRTGRANSAILEGVKVNAYGVPTPLAGVGNIHVPDAHLITIQPWDTSLIATIEKAILQSDLGFNPSNDGKLIRIPIPALTEERRKELVKLVKKMSEESKVAVRGERRDANEAVKKLEKDKEKPVSEDEAKRVQDEIQKVTDGFIKTLDEIAASKEKELLEL